MAAAKKLVAYVWWYGKGNPVNFSGFDDPEINRLLDEGRSEPDPAKRKKIYQDINRQMAKQVWEGWGFFTLWTVVENSKGPQHPGSAPSRCRPSKPGDTTTTDPRRQPGQGLAATHSLIGLWTEQ